MAELSGWLSLLPSRYRALALSRTSTRRVDRRDLGSTVASLGMLIVLEIAPDRNGWAAAIMRTWAIGR
jgi:hypothetical protein